MCWLSGGISSVLDEPASRLMKSNKGILHTEKQHNNLPTCFVGEVAGCVLQHQHVVFAVIYTG